MEKRTIKIAGFWPGDRPTLADAAAGRLSADDPIWQAIDELNGGDMTEPIGLRINLDQTSIVNDRTGAVEAPSEYVANLRGLELSIQRADEDIFRLKSDLKTAKEYREKSVAQLRTAIREGVVLPLLEADPDGDPDGDPDAL